MQKPAGFVNKVSDEQSQLGTKYSVPQIAFYKAVAELCPNEDCSVRLHKYCLKKRSLERRIEKICHGCGTPWTFSALKSELMDEDEEPVPPVKTEQPSGSRRKKLRSCANGHAAAYHPSSSQSQDPQPRKTTRSSARLIQ